MKVYFITESLEVTAIYVYIEIKLPILFIQEVRKRGLKVVVAGIPKTIDNDIPVPFLPFPTAGVLLS